MDPIKCMSLEDQIALCSGADNWHTKAMPDAGVPILCMSDGPHGLRKMPEGAGEMNINNSLPATCFPTAVLSACSWDPKLLEEVGRAIGEEARLMLARTPGNIVAVHPIERGVVSDYAVAEQMLRYFIQKAVGKLSFRKPKVNICIPADITEVELKAVEDAAYQAGAREVNLVEKPIAAAIGAGIDISMPAE